MDDVGDKSGISSTELLLRERTPSATLLSHLSVVVKLPTYQLLISMVDPVICSKYFVDGRYLMKSILLIDQMINSGGNFIIAILLARLLGVDGFGYYSIALIIGMFAVQLSQAIIISPAQTIAPKLPNDKINSYCRATMYIAILLAIFSGIVSIVGSFVVDIALSTFDRLAFSVAIVGVQLHFWARKTSYILEDRVAALFGSIVRYTIQFIFVGLLFYIDGDDMIAIQVLGLGISSLLGAVTSTLKWWYIDSFRYSIIDLAKKHWGIGKWLIGTEAFNWLGSNLIYVFAGALVGITSIGALRAAQNIIGVAGIVVQILDNVVPVSSARYYAVGGISRLSSYMFSISIPVLFIGLIICSIVAIFSNEIMWIVYGSEYMMYGNVLFILAISFMFALGAYFLKVVFRAVEFIRPIFYSQIAVTVFVLISSKYLIENYEIAGAALGLLYSQVISLGLLLYYLPLKITQHDFTGK